MRTTSISIVDDHQLFARALSSIVNSFSEFEVHSIIPDGTKVVERFSKTSSKPEIIILDVRMPQMSGIETMKWLNTECPEVKVLALSMENEEHTILSMIRSGARGYILKDAHPDDLKRALKEIRDRGFYHSDLTNNVLLDSFRSPHASNKPNISEREMEFIKLACSELTYKEIAAKMFLSPKTIDGYRDSLFRKLNVKSRTGMVIQAIKMKWVEIDDLCQNN